LALAYAPAARAQSGTAEDAVRVVEPTVVPAQVERIVRFRAFGFGEDAPFGGWFEAAALLDSNIDRATRADALGTVIANFTPDDLATAGRGGLGNRGKSALGVSLRSQAWLRRQIDNDSDLLVRASGSGELYGDDRYSDVALSFQAGPEYAVGSDRIAVFAGPTWRWYGAEPYSLALGGGASWRHPLGGHEQLRVEIGAAHVDNRRDDLLDGSRFTLTAEWDRALTPRSGIGADLLLARDTARESAFATASATLAIHAFREFDTMTLIATLGYGRLEADRAFAVFERRRVGDRFTASLAATFAALRLGPVAPLVRLMWERNRSSVAVYHFSRIAGEFGVTAAF
jgi:hypothetical protein